MSCLYCAEPPARFTDPPLCPVHLDLYILVDFMTGRKTPPTIENAQKLFDRCSANNGDWTITREQIAERLPGYLESIGLVLAPAGLAPMAAGQRNGQRTAQHADHSRTSTLGGDQ